MARKALVTGATGCLGRATIRQLRSCGYDVLATGRNAAVGEVIREEGFEFLAADLADAVQAGNAASGCDVIFHCAALSSPWGRRADFERANVDATRNLISACRDHAVDTFIHVSTPSIYFDFSERMDIAEDARLPSRFANDYAATKHVAEQIVLAADSDELKTVAIRPRAIFGPHDRALFPRLLRAAKRGAVPLFDGGSAIVDPTYVDNVADALILCDAKRLDAHGQVFNITNGEAMAVRDLLDRVFAALDYTVRFRSVSYRAALAMSGLAERVCRLLPGRPEPLVTPYSVGALGRSLTLNIDAAKRVLGYTPRVSVDDGLARFAAWCHAQGGAAS